METSNWVDPLLLSWVTYFTYKSLSFNRSAKTFWIAGEIDELPIWNDLSLVIELVSVSNRDTPVDNSCFSYLDQQNIFGRGKWLSLAREEKSIINKCSDGSAHFTIHPNNSQPVNIPHQVYFCNKYELILDISLSSSCENNSVVSQSYSSWVLFRIGASNPKNPLLLARGGEFDQINFVFPISCSLHSSEDQQWAIWSFECLISCVFENFSNLLGVL